MLSIENLLIGTLISAGSAFALTFAVRGYALKKDIMDCPNERSSHSRPTPRGGGLAIVAVSLLIMVVTGFAEGSMWIMGLGCALVALIGFYDDRRDIPPWIRLITHFSAALLVVYGSGGLPPLEFFGHSVSLGYMGVVVAVIGLVWLLNLYNFMDGINGIASIEGITVLLSIFLLSGLQVGFGQVLIQTQVLIAAAIGGFLVWNFPFARIFMGDAGSGFLGVTLGALMLYSTSYGQEWLWIWLIMLGVFVVDATVTLARRALRKQNVTEAHCTHAYQWASRIHKSHSRVTITVALINLLWLLPLAALVAWGVVDGFLMLLIAYLPLIALAIRYKAGTEN